VTNLTSLTPLPSSTTTSAQQNGTSDKNTQKNGNAPALPSGAISFRDYLQKKKNNQ